MKAFGYKMVKLFGRASVLYACLIAGALAFALISAYCKKHADAHAPAIVTFFAGDGGHLVFVISATALFFLIIFGFDNKPAVKREISPEKFLRRRPFI